MPSSEAWGLHGLRQSLDPSRQSEQRCHVVMKARAASEGQESGTNRTKGSHSSVSKFENGPPLTQEELIEGTHQVCGLELELEELFFKCRVHHTLKAHCG